MSIVEELQKAAEAVKKFRKQKSYAMWLDQKILIDEKALNDAKKLAAEYNESVTRLTASVAEKKANLELLNKYLLDNSETEDAMAKVEALAEKIQKMETQRDNLLAKVAEATATQITEPIKP